jgi:hypothetical protein
MRAFAVIGLAAALASCTWAERVGGRVNPDSMGLGDRCAAVMQAAIPYADIEIGNRTSQNKGVSTILAHVEGTRTDHPNQEGLARNLAADCEFYNTVLISFHLIGFAPEH